MFHTDARTGAIIPAECTDFKKYGSVSGTLNKSATEARVCDEIRDRVWDKIRGRVWDKII